MAQKFVYDWFLPAANGWGTIHPILDMASPLLAEEAGRPTQKELNSRLTNTNVFLHYGSRGWAG
jgi:hypothetical protein